MKQLFTGIVGLTLGLALATSLQFRALNYKELKIEKLTSDLSATKLNIEGLRIDLKDSNNRNIEWRRAYESILWKTWEAAKTNVPPKEESIFIWSITGATNYLYTSTNHTLLYYDTNP